MEPPYAGKFYCTYVYYRHKGKQNPHRETEFGVLFWHNYWQNCVLIAFSDIILHWCVVLAAVLATGSMVLNVIDVRMSYTFTAKTSYQKKCSLRTKPHRASSSLSLFTHDLHSLPFICLTLINPVGFWWMPLYLLLHFLSPLSAPLCSSTETPMSLDSALPSAQGSNISLSWSEPYTS